MKSLLVISLVLVLVFAGCAAKENTTATIQPNASIQSYTCPDGSIVINISTCPKAKQTLTCLNGIVVTNLSNCPKCPASCDDSNTCTNDSCSSSTNYTCKHTPISNISCGNAQICVSGACVKQTCSDGTVYGTCSSSKPKFCQNGTLVDMAYFCGCVPGSDVYQKYLFSSAPEIEAFKQKLEQNNIASNLDESSVKQIYSLMNTGEMIYLTLGGKVYSVKMMKELEVYQPNTCTPHLVLSAEILSFSPDSDSEYIGNITIVINNNGQLDANNLIIDLKLADMNFNIIKSKSITSVETRDKTIYDIRNIPAGTGILGTVNVNWVITEPSSLRLEIRQNAGDKTPIARAWGRQ